MAAQPWKPLFWERFRDSFDIAGHARVPLAAVARDLASPLRGGDDAPRLIEDSADKLAQAAKTLAFAISALGTVDLLALRCLRTDDATEVRARPRARAARVRASTAYDKVASARGHLGAAGRLFAASGIPRHAVDDELEAVLAAVEAAMQLIDGMLALRSDVTHADVALPRVDSSSRSAAASPTLDGARGPRRSDADAAWTSLGESVPGSHLRVALSGALAEIEAARAALRVGADAVHKAALGFSAPADWAECYSVGFRALDSAHAALSGLIALNSEAAVVFVRCAEKGCLSWEAARADAESHGRAALDFLWSASALWDYCLAGVVARGPGQEAEHLLRRALAEADGARHAGDHLRHAAARQFLYASMLFNHAPPPG